MLRSGVTRSDTVTQGAVDVGSPVPFRDLHPIARRQHALVTRDQALTALTRHQVEHALATGRIALVHRSVYRIAGSPESWQQAAHAAVLAGGPGAVLSFVSAAHLWDLAGYWEQPPVEITIPHHRRSRIPGVVVHDTKVHGGIHFDQRHGIPVTSVARTLCDLTACGSANQVGRALDDALRKKLTSLRAVGSVFDDLATRGRSRSTVMRALLDERGPGFHPGGSDPERRMLQTLVVAGLPAPIPQYRGRAGRRSYRLDGAYPEYLVAIEYEGFDAHSGRTAFDDRYERDRVLKNAGWHVVYVTSRTSAQRLVDDVLEALRTRGWPGPPLLPSLPSQRVTL